MVRSLGFQPGSLFKMMVGPKGFEMFAQRCRPNLLNNIVIRFNLLKTNWVGSGSSWKNISISCNDKLVLLGQILTHQCNFYAAQRFQRMTQIGSLYCRLYNDYTIQRMVARMRRWKCIKSKPFGFILGATLFNWEQEGISTNEMQGCIQEFDCMAQSNRNFGGNQQNNGKTGQGNVDEEQQSWALSYLNNNGWEPVISNKNLHVWRKAVPQSYLYEYKVFGSFHDIPARSFFNVQTDIEYRKKWDKLVIRLAIIDQDERAGSEIVHWVMHYPYPMYSRDYVYIRRSMVDTENGVMVLVSRATDHPACPIDKKYVRVQKYFSKMVIRPHNNFDEVGFDYLLSYFDDPEAAFPSPAYNWMASTGVPDFVEKLHQAARGLYLRNYSSPIIPTQAPLMQNSNNFQQNYT